MLTLLKWLFAGALLFGIYALVNAVVVEPSEEEKAAMKKLEPNVEQYAAATGTPEPKDARPVLSGRIVPIDLGGPEIDEGVYIRLPGELQALTPKQVADVVLIDYTEEKVGEYEDGADAIRYFAHLTIVDLPSGRQYTGKTVGGLEPTFTKVGGGEEKGQPVDKGNISDYLANLAR